MRKYELVMKSAVNYQIAQRVDGGILSNVRHQLLEKVSTLSALEMMILHLLKSKSLELMRW